MSTVSDPTDYEHAIATLVRQLPTERAAQLYRFARFLLQESIHEEHPDAFQDVEDDQVSEAELQEEDAKWDASMKRHADQFAALKAQAKADVQAKNTAPMFNDSGEFCVE